MRVGKKSKILLAFGLFAGFGIVDTGFHEFVGLYLVGVILIGLGIWLRKWRDGLEFYRRLKRAIYTIGFLTGILGILLFIKSSEWGFWFMVSVLIALAGLVLYTKKKHHIIDFQDLSEQQKTHADRVMRNYSFYPYRLFVDWVLRNPKYASARNALAIEEAKRSTGKSRVEIIFEMVFPLGMLVVIILFATGIVK